MSTTLVSQERSPIAIPNFPLYGKSKDGTQTLRGTQFRFGNDLESAHSASELRIKLKEQGIPANKIRKQVNSVLQGRVHVSYLQAQAYVEGMRAEGFIPDKAEKTSRSGVLRFVKMGSAAPARSEAEIKAKALADIKAKLLALGLSEDEISKL